MAGQSSVRSAPPNSQMIALHGGTDALQPVSNDEATSSVLCIRCNKGMVAYAFVFDAALADDVQLSLALGSAALRRGSLGLGPRTVCGEALMRAAAAIPSACRRTPVSYSGAAQYLCSVYPYCRSPASHGSTSFASTSSACAQPAWLASRNACIIALK